MLMSAASWAASDVTLYTEQFPPYNMTSDGKAFAHKAEDISGLCTDIVKQILQHVSLDVRMKLRNWSYGMSKTKQKPNTGLFCTAKTQERSELFQWVGPLTEIRWTLFARPDSSIKLDNLEAAKQYNIGGYKDDVMTTYLQDRGFKISALANDSVNPKRLMLNQIDLWVADELSGPYVASDSADIDGLKNVLVFKTSPLYIAFNPKTDPQIIKGFQQAYDKVKRSGQIEVIERTYGR
ncbi:ABC-type amino acid transport/signal transduction systems, periplasmic component/domain [Oceanobacter sp. RED65]|uniref:ABC-type amino acid transport/signal transduction systems, periplasmic component/domain n=2 Tax=Bermanella marisrubri TaxID=207949 RepID=Q1N405_9GAMM|nr:ABC-type amino acid transport/signal transduction systems, periplasmic component/domain [Oceanobacter sp. RED65] [Bermanella marisrubri]